MTDYFRCPGCLDQAALTVMNRLRAHPDPRTGDPCPGKGFCIDEPEYPQLIRLWGWETGQFLMKRENPGWTSPSESGPHPIGGLQQIAVKAYPRARFFTREGPLGSQGLVFRAGHQWYWMTCDGHVGERHKERVLALDSMYRHLTGRIMRGEN